MNIKPDPNTLATLSQFSGQQNGVAANKGTPVRPSNPDLIQQERQGHAKPQGVRTSNADNRVADLSSDSELSAAQDKATRFSREAPLGRSSLMDAAGGRDVPLGQIIDIKV